MLNTSNARRRPKHLDKLRYQGHAGFILRSAKTHVKAGAASPCTLDRCMQDHRSELKYGGLYRIAPRTHQAGALD